MQKLLGLRIWCQLSVLSEKCCGQAGQAADIWNFIKYYKKNKQIYVTGK